MADTAKKYTLQIFDGPAAFIVKADRRRKNELSFSPIRTNVTDDFLDGIVKYARNYCLAHGVNTMVLRHVESKEETVHVVCKDIQIEKNFQKLFAHYKLSPEELTIVEGFEDHTGFEIIRGEEVTDQKSFVEIMKYNIDWFQRWASEQAQIAEKDLRGLSYYMDVVFPD